MQNFINKYTISILIMVLTTLLITKYYQFSRQAPQQTTIFSGKITPINYTNSTLLNTFTKKNIDEYQTAAGIYDIQTIASEVTSTMLTTFSNSTSKTLPLVANWNVGISEYSNGLDPLYMISRFTYGEHLVPTWKLDPYYNDKIGLNYYEASVKKAAKLGLPLVFILPSPESALTKDDVYFNMDKMQNPNVITVNGTVLPKLSPFSPDSLWNEVGEQWSSTSLMAQLQEWYPNPPLVVFIDEDSSEKLSWSKLATSSRYIEQYPTNTSNEFKRTLVNAKWLEKYRQLHEGFKQGFTKKAWKQNVKFVTRNQLASNMGVTEDWINSTTTTNQYANIWPLTADGLTINFNLDGDKTDTTNAPHTLLNNLPFMLDEAKILNPNFTYQLSINANKKIDNSQRYRGFTQFALWFLRPSIIRQTPNKNTKDEINPLFQQIVDSVELIHNSDVLADFWKNGKLVSTGNSNYTQNIPTNYQNVPREFLLKTDATVPVWSFALEKGVAPNREWLVYVQFPEEDLSDVTITIPDFENVSLGAVQEGNFYLISENNTTQTTTTLVTTKSLPTDTNQTIFHDGNKTIILPNFSVPIDTTGAINVKDYGAKGDGVTDDYNAILAAEAAGTKLYFPKGTYITSAMWNVKSTTELIYGEGKIACNFVHENQWPSGALRIKETDKLVIDGLSFEWRTVTNSNYGGVLLFGYQDKPISNVIVQNCTFTNPTLHNSVAIGTSARNYNERITNVKVYNNTFSNFITTPIGAVNMEHNRDYEEITMFDFEYKGNKLLFDSSIDTTGSGLAAAMSNAGKVHDLDFSFNYIKGYHYGVEMSGVHDNKITHNTFVDTLTPLWINNGNNGRTPYNNYYAYNTMSDISNQEGALIWSRGSRNSIFEYNTIYGHIYLESGSDDIFQNNKIISPSFKGISLNNTDNVIVKDNYIESTNDSYGHLLITSNSAGINTFKNNRIYVKGTDSFESIDSNDISSNNIRLNASEKVE